MGALDEYYDWFYGWARVPADTYKADIALISWLLAKTQYELHEHLSRCDAGRCPDVQPEHPPPVSAAP
jgi:hypothetical protein